MKTLQLSDEDYEFLIKAQHMLKTQDNRCTSNPVYCVMKKKRVYGLFEDYSSDYEYILDGESFCCDDDDLYNALIEYGYDNQVTELIKVMKEDYDTDKLLTEKEYFNTQLNYCSYEIEEFLRKLGIIKVYYSESFEISREVGCFSLFEEDVIERKHDYCVSSYNSCNMNTLRNLLINLEL